MENFHGDNLNPHNINKPSCTHQSLQETQHLCHLEHCLSFLGPEHLVPKIYEYLTKRPIKSNQHMDNPNTFSNYVKTTFNNGLSLSEVDLSHLKRETTNMDPASWKLTGDETLIPITHQKTKHGPGLMEVDWGGNIEPNYTSSGCMLMQVDWGGKLRVNI